jgi:hypothetical protein
MFVTIRYEGGMRMRGLNGEWKLITIVNRQQTEERREQTADNT